MLGAERLVVVLTPAQPQTPVEDLSFLAQDSLVLSRGVRGPGLSSALEEAGFGLTTRSATAPVASTQPPSSVASPGHCPAAQAAPARLTTVSRPAST